MALFAGIMMLPSCAKHDFFYENAITGRIGPQAFWRLESSTARAGTNLGFDVQYYTTVAGETIDRIEVWYDVWLVEVTSVSSRWVPSFTAMNNRETTTQLYIAQLIHEIPHSPAFWNDSVKAYWLIGEQAVFPISVTRVPFSWSPSETFSAADSARVEEFFGAGFMETFKQQLYAAMSFADFHRMLVTGLQIMEEEDFNKFRTRSQIIPELVYNPATGEWEPYWREGNYFWHFLDDVVEEGEVVRTVVPQEITEIFNNEVTFAQLVQAAEGYNISYNSSSRLNAHLRIFDTRGVFSTTRVLPIEVN